MAPLQTRPEQIIGADHVRPSPFHGLLLVLPPQVQMLLEQLSQQVTAPDFEEFLQLVMRQPARLRRGQIRHEHPEQIRRRLKAVRTRRHR